MSKPIEVSDQEFHARVLESDKPVLVDFWAPWCGPCRMVAPVLEELAGEYADRMTIAKVNTDEQMETAGRLGIRGIPTLILFAGGREVERIVGALPKHALQTRVDAALAAIAPAAPAPEGAATNGGAEAAETSVASGDEQPSPVAAKE